MREKDYYGAIKGFCLKWNLPEVWNSDRITGANLIYEVIKVINAMIVEQKEVKEMIEDFIKMFDENLDETVKNILIDWKDSGMLDDIINDALFNQKLDKNIFYEFEIQNNSRIVIDFNKKYEVNEGENITSKLKEALLIETKPIYISEGNYSLDQSIELTNNKLIFENVKLEYLGIGSSYAIVMKDDSEIVGLNIDMRNYSGVCLNVLGSDCVLKNIKIKNINNIGIECDYANNLIASNIYIENSNTINNNLIGAFRINNSFGVNLNDITILETFGKGLVVSRCDFVVINNVYINGVYERQPAYYSARGTNVTLTDLKVSNARCGLKLSRDSNTNRIENVLIDTSSSSTVNDYAVFIQGSSNNILNNMVINSKDNQSALRIEQHPDPEGGDSFNNTVKNVIINCENTTIGVYLNNRTDGYNSKKIFLSNVEVNNPVSFGVRLDNQTDIVLESILVKNSQGVGFQTSSGSNIKLINSEISSEDRSYSYGTENLLIFGCIMSTNNVERYTLELSNCKNVKLDKNTLTGSGKGFRTVKFEDLIITNNVFKTLPSSVDIPQSDSNYIIFTNNIVFGTNQIYAFEKRYNNGNLSRIG